MLGIESQVINIVVRQKGMNILQYKIITPFFYKIHKIIKASISWGNIVKDINTQLLIS